MYISKPFPTRGGLTRCTDGWGGDDFCFLLTGARFEKLLEIYNKFRYMIRISSSISIIQASTVFLLSEEHTAHNLFSPFHRLITTY